ncbi:H-2 class I histocompatibility antigen, K-Q alpha chain-like [Megalops cyprinoides]|uniref:H-2 class I histocompatibility antigen, K-Q alpha chain-like n=1 Tax=Megalops cyprinoides TaxID=118141 RepID=UPI001864F747|nr:H-2 class I histocompatibility antigen, K-Q alpha chain-like [Megalops cyprinoides]
MAKEKLLGFCKTSVEGSHSLWVLATFIHGQTEFPEFSAVLMLDDVQLLYYGSNIKKFVSRIQQNSNDGNDEAAYEGSYIVAGDMYDSLKWRSLHLKVLSNHSVGVHVYQRMAGCELNDGKPSPIMEWDAYDGTEAIHYNMRNHTFNALWPASIWKELKLETARLIYTNIYQPICIKTLKHYLNEEKNIVMRKERPRVRLIQKTDRDTGGVTVSCLATGFYPRHINLTMLRDGRPITEQDLTLGEVLPNGDGTYQLRRSLSVSEEELREKHHYTCTVTHLSLDNKLDVSWEPEDDPDNVFITVVIVLVLIVFFTTFIAAFIICKRRHKECPRVRLIQKTDRDTGGVTVSYLATGFYPQHINLTMLRDGQPITEQELTVGEVLPNGDGMYQLRRSLSVSEEELREKHHYTCTVTHLSLDNKLDVSWGTEDRTNT